MEKKKVLLTLLYLSTCTLCYVHSSQQSVSSDGQRNSNPIQTSLYSKRVVPNIIPMRSDIGEDADLNKHVPLKREVLQSNVHPKNKAHPKNKTHPPTTPASDTNKTTNPIIAPLNGTIHWLKEQDLERQSTNAFICLFGLLFLLFGCIWWSGMLKQKNNVFMYAALDGSFQSAQEKDKLFTVDIKELIQSKLRSIKKRVRRKRKRTSKGPSYLELKHQEIEMSSTSEEELL